MESENELLRRLDLVVLDNRHRKDQTAVSELLSEGWSMTLKGTPLYRALRNVRHCGRAAYWAASRKLCVLSRGESPVSHNCQISDLRARYYSLELPERTGCFVEVGAFDGENYSNTSFLADQGWRGLYVEPVPAHCVRTRIRHAFNRVEVEQVAVAEQAGTAELNLMDALSTINARVLEGYSRIAWSKKFAKRARSITVKTDTIEAVLTRHSIPRDFDLMIVDVEGGEEPVIEGLLSSSFRPRVLIVELCDNHPGFEEFPTVQRTHAALRDLIREAGYTQTYVDHFNTVFCRQRLSRQASAKHC